jgi:thiol-disulfide isomerase/thioredoxin
MPSPRRWTQLLLLVLSLVLVISACHRRTRLPEGDITESLTLPALGDQLETTSLLGKPALVVFVSPTCPHCIVALPIAQDAARASDANIVAVFVVGRRENAAGVVETTKFAGPVLIDDGTLRQRYEVTSVPYTLVLRSDGRANDAFLGTQDKATLQSAIADAR